MFPGRGITFTLSCAALCWLTVAQTAKGDVITSPGGFKVGIHITPPGADTNAPSFDDKPSGILIDTVAGIGFQRSPTSPTPNQEYDPLIPGAPRDAWGIQAKRPAGGVYSGFADAHVTPPGTTFGGIERLLYNSHTFTSSSASISTFLLSAAQTAGGKRVLQIDQEFRFAKDGSGNTVDNVLEILVKVSNITANSVKNPDAAFVPDEDLRVDYRRIVNWQFSTTDTNEVITVNPIFGPITSATPHSFIDKPSPTPDVTESPDPATGNFDAHSPSGGTFGAVPPPAVENGIDGGGGINLDLGILSAFDNPLTLTIDEREAIFSYYYAINKQGQTEEELRQQLQSLGINYLITGRNARTPSVGDFPAPPLAAAIGLQVVPEPATLTLLAVGLAGLAACRWRRRRSG